MKQIVLAGEKADETTKRQVNLQWNNTMGEILMGLEPMGAEHEGVFISLDRPGTNRLIRLLRKARDDAFGKDE